MSSTRPEGVAIVSNATEPTTRMLMSLQRLLAIVAGRSRCAAKSDMQRLATNDYFTYFPTINFNFSFVAGGILSRSVKMACANADPHLHDRVFGRPATVALTTLAAFSAFFTSTAMI